ncbi:aminotransferase class IV [Alistipes sp. OttesenSCG-928-B03]|nr:aminotransferase class IV [Alistipes sp. OttesenSCG-928-B03]
MRQQFSEAIKLKDGVFYNLPYHQARMDLTLAQCGGVRIDLASALANIADDVDKGLFKCRLIYGMEGVESVEFIPYSLRLVTTVGLVTADDIEYGFKYTDRTRLNELLAQSGCDDMIIVKNGLVTDAFAANLVFESCDGLFTPDTYLLPGTKRQHLLDMGIIRLKHIVPEDIKAYDCIRFINAMVDLEDNICINPCRIEI